MQDSKRDTDVLNSLLDSVGEGEGGMIWENGIFFFFKKFYLFLFVLGLGCCLRTFSSSSEKGLLSGCGHGPLMAVASLVAEHRL